MLNYWFPFIVLLEQMFFQSILPYKIFHAIKKLKPIKGREVHVTDAIRDLILNGNSFFANIFKGKSSLSISTPKIESPKDPTGCGDAYRAGLVYGIMKNMSLEAIGELSSALGALKVQSFGTQNHTINNDIKKLL